MDLKSLIESLIVDMTNDAPMHKISSKAHIISSLLDNVKSIEHKILDANPTDFFELRELLY